jgi:hypothetical protein
MESLNVNNFHDYLFNVDNAPKTQVGRSLFQSDIGLIESLLAPDLGAPVELEATKYACLDKLFIKCLSFARIVYIFDMLQILFPDDVFFLF